MSELRAQQERFANNRLIDKIKDEPYWTVSDDKKRPLDANLLVLHPAKFALASFKNDNWPLIPLTELDNDDRLTYTNRAYRLHAEDNRVICIDMEKTASEELRESLKKFPVDYAEISLSGSGIHYLIEIPEDLIPDEAKYLFDDQVVVKSDDGSWCQVWFAGFTGYMLSSALARNGMTVDEAVSVLDKYLDDAAIAHLDEVRVVHGKGTGALRAGVQNFLRKNKHVQSYRLGEYGEGDAGVTIVKLK